MGVAILLWVWPVQTLCALFRAVFQKRMADLSFDAIDTIVGFDAAESQMKVRRIGQVAMTSAFCVHSESCGVCE